MSHATTAADAVAAAPPNQGAFDGAVAIASIVESSTNPRRNIDSASLLELAENIRQVGILEPLILRVREKGFGLVAGARRLRAAKIAGLITVPAMVHDWTDAQALEAQIVENLQRADIHPLEEADAFRQLLTVGAYTPASLAAKIGRSVRFVTNRLKLEELAPAVRTAFDEARITVSHAERLAGLPAALQTKALKEACFERVFDYEDGVGGKAIDRLAPVRSLDEWINLNVRLDLSAPTLQQDFPELLPEVKKAEAAGATVLMLSDRYDHAAAAKLKPGEPLPHDRWRDAKATEKGAQLGVVVIGRRRGKTLHVALIADEPRTVAPAAATKSKPTSPKAAAAQKAADRKAREDEERRRAKAKAENERRGEVQTRIATALLKSTPTMNDAQLRAIALGLVSAMGESFDQAALNAAGKVAGIPPAIFTYAGAKGINKLPASKLRGLIALLVVGFDTYNPKALPVSARAFGVDVAAIEKAVVNERQAAAAKKTKTAATLVARATPAPLPPRVTITDKSARAVKASTKSKKGR